MTPPAARAVLEKTKSATPSLRVLQLIEALAQSNEPLSLAELMRVTGEPKATLHRMLATLEEAGWLAKEPSGKHYAPGRHLAQLGLAALTHGSVARARHAILTKLVAEVNESVNLAILDETEVAYLDRVDAAWPLRMDLKPGSRVPLHCSASGKLILAHRDETESTAIVDQLTLTRYTGNTLVTAKALKHELVLVREQGYAFDNEEFYAGLFCVAVPVIDTAGRCIAGVAIQAPVARLPREMALKHLARLQRAARDLARTFDYANA